MEKGAKSLFSGLFPFPVPVTYCITSLKGGRNERKEESERERERKRDRQIEMVGVRRSKRQ